MSNTGNTGSAVATITSGANTSNPTIVFKSVGSFSIRADASYSSNYTIAHTISEPIEVTKDKPIVKFSSIYDPSYPYQYSTPYEFVNAPAYIQNNTGQTLKYSIVTDDSTVKSFKPSNIATITNDGTSFVTNTVGKFKIRAYTPKTLNRDFGSGSALSDTIEIIKIKPTILQYPQIILTPPVTSSTLVYRQPYTINPLPITVTGIATQYNYVGYGAHNINVDTLWYANYCVDVTGSTCHAEYRLRFSNGIVSNLTLTSDSPDGLTNPDLLFALSNVPFDGVTAILQGLNISTGSDNLWYDIDVPEQFITQDQSTVTFSGSSGTGNFKSTPSLFQASVSTISSNTDTNPPPNINYTSSDETVATISGSNVTIVGIGHFYILVTVSPTTNYTQILRSASPQKYETIQAIPTITSFPTTTLSAQKWNYNQQYPGIIPIANNIPTTNTDTNGPLITYSTNDANDTNIATISGNTINITGVGNFQILVTIHSTTNFSTVTYTYPSGLVYNSDTTYTSYNAEPATPIIKFPKKFITSSRYGSTYIFVPAEISNSDPSSQTLTYSIINSKPVVASTTPVATLKYKPGVINPSVVINSVGTFQIQASCLASENGFYNAAFKPSDIITISKEIPNIVFNTSNFKSSYTCQPTKPYSLTTPIASITNNKAQLLTYSIVETDGDTPSNIASISSDGTSLTTNSVGSFQIFATPTAVANGDYGKQGKASETIKIESATPTVITFPTLPSTFTYGNTYTIPSTITTTNTDTQSVNFVYSTSQTSMSIATISGNTITIVGVGNFQISVTIGATANYKQATYVYPSQSTYYTSIQATPTITFPSNFGSGWVIGGTYNLTSTITTNAGYGYTDPNQVTYSLVTTNNKVKMVAVVTNSGGTNSIAYSYDGINWTGAGNSVMSSCNCVAWNGNIWLVGGNAGPVIIFSVNGINWFPANSVTMSYVGSIAWNGTIWVAVGLGSNSNQIQYNYNTISYSYDGINWTASNNSLNIFSNCGNGVAWNGSIWVAVGSGTNSIAYSSDGINWKASNNSLGIFANGGNGIAWNGSIWVAVGNGTNSIAYSSDGIYWTGSNNSLGIFSSYGSGIAWNGTIWVAVGGGTNSIAYSSDGVNWTASNSSTNIFGNYSTGISWNGSLWVAVGSSNNANNAIAYSSDGANWIGANNINGSSLTTIFSYASNIGSTELLPNTVTSPKPVIVALSYATSVGSSTIYYSNDGMNWTPAYGVNSSNNSGTIFSSSGTGVAWNGSMWVAVGSGTNTIAYSINGQYWYPSNNSMNIFSSYGQDVAWNGSLWVAVGSGGNTIAYSPDGINWTGANNINGGNSTTIFSNSGNGIAWNGSIWVAVGSGTNSIAYSSDGINWIGSNNSTTIFSNSGNGIAWNGETWVAVGSGTNTIAYSSDGINWRGATNIVNDSNTTTIFSLSGADVAWNGSMWVAVGNGTNNTIAYSYDGKEWMGVGNSIFSLSGNGVTWYVAYNMWIVTGRGSYDIGYSKDGINWFPVNNSANIFTGTGSYGMAVASTSSVVFYTNQGNTNNIATINGSQITINDVGTFQIQASLAATNNFLPALPIQSNTITIVTVNVSLLSNNFSNFVYGGGPYTLSVTTNNTDTNPPPIITYSISPQSGSTGNGTINGSQLTITAAGGAYIYVNVTATENFNSLNTCVYVNIAQATQVFSLNTPWFNEIFNMLKIGDSFGAGGGIAPGTSNNTDPGGTMYSYTSSNSSVATIVNGLVTCISPGEFYYSITAAATANFSAVTLSTRYIYVSVIPEVIIFNNPQTFPPSASQSGEVGMAICITDNAYPFGFNNYSALTITNGGNSFTLNAQTSPTYSSVINKYMVFFEPATTGSFSNDLNPNIGVANIACVNIHPLANGMSGGQDLLFSFSGNTNSSIPCIDPFSFNWNPGNLDISQGLVYGAFYTLANNITSNIPVGSGVTISTLNSGCITGYYTAPWAGYNTNSVTGGLSTVLGMTVNYSDIQEAWGVWGFSGNIYGNTISLNQNGANYYYIGIPQMTSPAMG